MPETEPMTFEDLSAAYRIEIKTQALGDVRKDLYSALMRLQEKIQKDYETEFSKDPDSIMCEGMNERRKKVMLLSQKVIDLRMEKIVVMALRTSMGAENVLDKLTKEERTYYDNVVSESGRHRALVFRDKTKKNYVIPNVSAERTEAEVIPANIVPDDTSASLSDDVCEEVAEPPGKEPEKTRDDLIMIRILEDLPGIAGPDCDYDLKKEDIVRMPVALANALIKHEKAVTLNVTP